MTDNDVPRDKSGRQITVGSYIVYGHALGRCAGLRFGKALEITAKRYDEGVYVSRLDSKWSIRVIGYDDDALFRSNKVNARAGNLGFPDRILVIPPEWLTEEIRSALDSFVLKKGKT